MRNFVGTIMMILAVSTAASAPAPAPAPAPWQTWIKDFGHDAFQYPAWVKAQMADCRCEHASPSQATGGRYISRCADGQGRDAHDADTLTYCGAKQWLLDHMPEFDKGFMPPSVAVDGASMFDDNIVFALMAYNASAFMRKLPLALVHSYVLPYADFHEARVNWRPLLFAKFFGAAGANAASTVDAIRALAGGPFPHNLFTNWTSASALWPAAPIRPGSGREFTLDWASSTSPPVISPFDFAAYGYGSCSAWASLLAYAARAVGVPARQCGTPCWNDAYGGVDFSGLAKDNPNVSVCWHGGATGATPASNTHATGGFFLNNHNWVEYWDDVANDWVFINVPPATSVPDAGGPDNCNGATAASLAAHGCGWSAAKGCSAVSGGPGAAMRDHEIFAYTWSDPHDGNTGAAPDGGAVLDVEGLVLSSGESVSPLVWSPRLASPVGAALKNDGLRVVNRTDFYRCRE